MSNNGGWQLKSNVAQRYLEFCQQAIDDDHVYTNFRQQYIYQAIVETANIVHGFEFINMIKSDFGERVLSKNIEKAKLNDQIGNPILHSYGKYGLIAPTTLRYLKTAFDMIKYFDIKPNWDICECGVGYGGLCAIMHRMYEPKAYQLIDLQAPHDLAVKYLNDTIPEIGVNEHGNIDKDLFISCYAFSELGRKTQDHYLNNFIPFCRCGYLAYNNTEGSYSYQEIMEKIPNSIEYPENITASRARIIVWNRNN